MDDYRGVLRAADEVRTMVETNGWREYIEPLIDKMIIDILGGKVEGRWIHQPKDFDEDVMKEEKFRFLLGYKQALIDLHSRIYQFIDDGVYAEAEMIRQKESDIKSDYEPEKGA